MKPKAPTARDFRKFGLFLAGFLLALSALSWWREGWLYPWSLGASAGVALVALAYPPALKPVFFASLKVGGVMGWINTRVLLSVMFYAVFTPMGLVMRMVRGEAGWTGRAHRDSYWHPREKADVTDQMRHQF